MKIIGLMVIAIVASLAFCGCAEKGEKLKGEKLKGEKLKGEKLWDKACVHSYDVFMSQAAPEEEGREFRQREPTREELDAARESCVRGYRILSAQLADEAAICSLGKTDMAGIGGCLREAVEKDDQDKKRRKEGPRKEAK
jgi:hypothetical protein